jgi:hypothetical protein
VHNNPANTNDSARVILSFDLLQPQKITTPGSSPPGGTLLKLILVQHLSLPLWRTLALKFMLIRCLVCPRLGFLLKIRSACSSTRHVLHPLSLCRVSIEDSSSVQQHSPRAASSESVSSFY